MLALSLLFAMICIFISLLFNAWRLIIGPEITDRILAVDTMYVNCVALIILFGIYTQSDFYFEAAALIALLGFIATAAFCKFLLRGDIIE